MSNSETHLGGVNIQQNINMETWVTWKGRGTCPSAPWAVKPLYP